MDFLNPILQRLPDTAKDIRLNLDSVLARSSLNPDDTLGIAIAAAFAAGSAELVSAFKSAAPAAEANAALAAAALMGMNNVWYPFVEMAGDDELKTMRPELRMSICPGQGPRQLQRDGLDRHRGAQGVVGHHHRRARVDQRWRHE